MSVSPKFRWGGGRHRNPVYDDVVSIENLFAAWRAFAKGKRNRIDVVAFEMHLEDRLFELHDRLVSGEWQHGPYEMFTVRDPKPRVIHKASVEDRIVHHALVRVIEPVFDCSFIYDSWSCRRGKGTHGAVSRLCSQLRKVAQETRKPVWVLKVDVRKYFASVDQEVLLRLVRKKIHDPALLKLITCVVLSYRRGIPLGNLTSQLFANVYLDPFDHFVKERLRPFVYLRYCDDMVFIHSDKDWLRCCLCDIEQYLSRVLYLELHPQKISLKPWHHGIDWLGHIVYPDRVMMRASTKRRIQRHMDMTMECYFDGGVDEDELRSIFASYDGLLKRTSEGDIREFYQLLYECL